MRVLKKASLIFALFFVFCMNVFAEDTDLNSVEIVESDEILNEIDLSTQCKERTDTMSDVVTGNMQIINGDIQNGTFEIKISNVTNISLLSEIDIAVWSTKNGQDDLVWYAIKGDSSTEYYQKIDIKNHKYSLGEYNVHVYFTDTTGKTFGLGSAIYNMDYQKGNLSVEQKNATEYQITLDGVIIPGGIQTVKIPVWSKKNGQDDLVWYDAKRQSENVYTVVMNLSNHKCLEEYYIHAYAFSKSGEGIGVASTEMMIESPEIGNIIVEDSNINKGVFRVKLSDIVNEEKIKEIYVPIWSKVNGQDDLIWYKAKKDVDDGCYYIDVNIKNHKYSTGIYYIHTYITDVTGYQYITGATEQIVTIEKNEFNVIQNSNQEYIVRLTGLKVPGGLNNVLFPVWSEVNGQDDIRWYIALKEDDGIYSVKVPIKNHNGLGKYNVHAYVEMPNGNLVGIGSTFFETKTPIIENIEATVTDKVSGQFQVKISGIQNGELIKKVLVPIWSEKNQGDIRWYTATKNQDGDYVVNVNIANHKYNCGEYNVHVYMEDIAGGFQGVGVTTCDMGVEFEDLTVKDIDGTEATFRMTLNGLMVPAGEKNVLVAVWGNAGGQNDLKWYEATKQSNDSYICDIKVRNHSELGRYNVHVYCVTKQNQSVGIGTTSFEVIKKPTMAGVEVSDVNGTNGTFKITVTGIMAPSGVEKVQIPVWCSDDQSDIVWYAAKKISEGIYTVNVNVANHAHHFGTYKIHVYVTMNNGIRVMTGMSAGEINPQNYVYNTYISATRREVAVMGVTASRVQFPTWSDANGQDDIVWYDGTNNGNGKWSAIVDSGKHNSGGNYTTHVYVTSGGNVQSIGATTYSLSKIPTDQSQMLVRANMYSSSTPYLILVNRSTHKVGVFQGWQGNWNCIQFWDCADGAPSSPTVEGTFRIGSRGYYFDSGASRCYWYTQFYGNYLFHSVLYNKNGTLQDGRVGMALSHGCVRLQIQNAKWIYDTIPSGTTVVVYH